MAAPWYEKADRVRESTSNKPNAATAYDLAGARVGAQTFVAAGAGGKPVAYCAERVDALGNPSGAWEVGVGTVTDAAPDTLSRDVIFSSSTGGAAIDWSATGENSSPDVFLVDPAAFFVGRGGATPPLAAGRWYGPMAFGGFTTQVTATDWIDACPISVCVGQKLTAIGIEVTAIGAPGSQGRLGLYEDQDGVPGPLLVDAGLFNTGVTGINTKTIAVWPKTPWVWGVYTQDGGTTRAHNVGANAGGQLINGFADAGAVAASHIVRNVVGVLAAGFPDPFGAVTYSAGANVPEIRVRT